MNGLLKTGRLYKMVYHNFGKDPQPLVLILANQGGYIEGVNINYLSPTEMRMLANIVAKLKVALEGIALSGDFLYRILHGEARAIVDRTYRKYQFRYISNPYLVSNGITDADSGNFSEKPLYIGHPFVKYLNEILKSEMLENYRPEGEKVREQIIKTIT